jgi:hypothetical protein
MTKNPRGKFSPLGQTLVVNDWPLVTRFQFCGRLEPAFGGSGFRPLAFTFASKADLEWKNGLEAEDGDQQRGDQDPEAGSSILRAWGEKNV